MNCVIFLLGLLSIGQILAQDPPCDDACQQEKDAQACRDARVALDQLAANGQNYWKVPANKRSIGQKHLYGRVITPGRRILARPPQDRPIPPRPGQNGPAALPASLPESYSVRDVYGEQCPSVKQTFAQGCGNCWAMATASAINDRECIYRPAGSPIRYVSAPVLTACPYNARDGDNGCKGGNEEVAWDYWKNEGVPTGGDTSIPQTPSGCQPFDTYFKFTENNQCKRTCDAQKAPGVATVSKGAVTYGIATKNETEIMEEIYLYGPVTAWFRVYRDFGACFDGKGIYKHVSGDQTSAHAIKIYGWGVENGIKYWRIQNSWGTWWGENGSFRFLRGTNEASIEEGIFAGIPEVNGDPDCEDDPAAAGGFCETALANNFCNDPTVPIAAESCKKTCGLC